MSLLTSSDGVGNNPNRLRALLDVRDHIQAFAELIRLLTKHRELTLEMARREITDRYQGQTLGLLWAMLHPLILILVYVFLFVLVFKVRIGGTREMPLDYTAYLLSGLIPWLTFQEAMSKGSTVITNHGNLVKQVVFPIEILPVKTVIASMTSMSISLALLLLYVLAVHRTLFWTYAIVPVLLFFQVLAMIGINYILSSVGVYFRDVKEFVQVHNFVGLYVIPLFYLPEQVPGLLRPLLYVNPFSYFIWCYQDALYYGEFRHWWAWIAYVLMSLGIFYTGYRIFKKLKPMFGNVL